MKIVFLLTLTIILMILGHIFKVLRWGQFISVYEKPDFKNLLTSLSLGHLLNAILPLRIGDVVRIILAGKRLKNSFSFAISTVFVDIYLDLILVGLIFLVLYFLKKGGMDLELTAIMYGKIFLVIIPVTIIFFAFKKMTKFLIQVFASIFNEKIEFRILYLAYLVIASIKDIVFNINKFNLVFYTALMWGSYLLSYKFFADVLQILGLNITASDVFNKIFKGQILYNIRFEVFVFWFILLVFPLLVCLLIVFLMKDNNKTVAPRRVLPQLNKEDKFAFLKIYYSDVKNDFVNLYLSVNKNITVLEDKSSGSNASVLLVLKDDSIYYRKYAFGTDGVKLKNQTDWIIENKDKLALPEILNIQGNENYYVYDMPYSPDTISFFDFIHTVPLDKSSELLKNILDDLKPIHYESQNIADLSTINMYIDEKITKNIKKLLSNPYIKMLEQYDEIIINGVAHKTLKKMNKYLEKENLINILSNDRVSDIHGDLTVENIVCIKSNNNFEYNPLYKKGYYLIDPNTGNILNSPFLDYSKLLQSLHSNYEFLTKIKDVYIDKNMIDYLFTSSGAYSSLYEFYKKYLTEKFDEKDLKSIYFHEIVHFLRLIPYRNKKDLKLSVIFYCRLLMLLEEFFEGENEKK